MFEGVEGLKIEEVIGGYKKIVLPLDEARRLVETILKERGATRDLEETLRILENFDEFYNIQYRRGKSYIVPHKNMSEMIKGLTVIDKLKLFKENGKRSVELVIDKRVETDYIVNLIRKIREL